MSEHHEKKDRSRPPQSQGWIAEYVDEHGLLEAARKVREAGYTKTDAFTPYPVHGIDHALGIRPTVLPFIVLVGGFTGLGTALLMQYWMNAVDYPYLISGKPLGSWPAFIPVTFELTVLFSAITTFLGSILLNRLPKYSNPVFTSPRFDRATDDRFFLYVDSSDRYFNKNSVQNLLSSTNPESLEEVMEDASSTVIPRAVWLSVLLLLVIASIPMAIILKMRNSNSPSPRWHVFFDMDFQPKKKPQQISTLFADGRAMRSPVLGTVARGQWEGNDAFYLGYDPAKLAAHAGRDRSRFVGASLAAAMQDPVGAPALGQPPTPDEEKSPESAIPAGSNVPAKSETSDEMDESSNAAEKPSDEPSPGDEATDGKVMVEETQTANDAASPSSGEPANPSQDGAALASAVPTLPFVTNIPMEIDAQVMELGKKKFEIYCSVCHGVGGDGDGLVARRAEEIAQSYWLPPTSLHADAVRSQPVGQVFYTISNGKGKMAGYGAVLTPKERWAVVLYVKALQRSRNASESDVPLEMQSKLSQSK